MPQEIIFDTEATDLDAPEIVEAAWLAVNSLSPLTLGDGFEQLNSKRCLRWLSPLLSIFESV